MYLDNRAYFLTFVLFGFVVTGTPRSEAAPSTDVRPAGIILNDTKEYFYPGRTVTDTTDLGVGGGEGIFDLDKKRESMNFLILGRSHYQENDTAYDYRILLASRSLVGLEGGYRFVFKDILPDEPYVKAGMTILMDPKDQFANLIDYQRYYLQMALGFDNLFKYHRSLKFEVGGRAGSTGTHVFASVIYGISD